MTERNGRPNPSLLQELRSRGFHGDSDPPYRETPIQMCWVRAIIDSQGPSRDHFKLELFYRDPDRWIANALNGAAPVNMEIVALATKYRLTR